MDAPHLRQAVPAVDAQRVVDAGDYRQPLRLHQEDAVAQGLVVVNEVERLLLRQLVQLVVGAHAECEEERAEGETGRHHLVEIERMEVEDGVRPVAVLVDVVHEVPHAVRLQPVQVDALIHFRVGPAGDDVDFMAEPDHLAGHVVDEDSLTAGVGVPLIDDEGDPHQPLPRSGFLA
jgi:hypothetical protein